MFGPGWVTTNPTRVINGKLDQRYLLKGTEPCQDKETRHKCSGLGVDNDLTIGLIGKVTP